MLINRAPVLTLWGTIMAQRMGYSENEALTLGKAVAGYTAQFKGRTLGIYTAREKGKPEEGEAEEQDVQITELMGRQIPISEEGGEIRALTKDKPIDPESVQRYLQNKFCENLDEISAAMEALAGSYEPQDLDRIGFRLYEKFRPDIPKGNRGWGAKGELSIQKITGLKK